MYPRFQPVYPYNTYHYECQEPVNIDYQIKKSQIDQSKHDIQSKVRKGLQNLNEKNELISSLNCDINSLNCRINSQNEEIIYLKSKLEEKSKNMDDQYNRYCDLNNENQNQLKSKNQLEHEIQQLKQEIRMFQQHNENCVSKQHDIDLFNQQQNKELQNLRDQNHVNMNNINEKQNLINQLKDQNRQLMLDLQHKASTVNKKDEIIENQNEKIITMNKDLTNMKQTIMEKDTLIKELTLSQSVLQTENSSLQDKLQQLQSELSQVYDNKASEEQINQQYANFQEQQQQVNQQVDLLISQPVQQQPSWPISEKELKATLFNILDYLGSSINTLMFQVFMISGFGAKCRSLNSLPAFYKFMIKFSAKNGQALTVCCYTYQKVKSLLRTVQREDEEKQKSRDKGNQWLEQQIKEVKGQVNKVASQEEQKAQQLFRYLAIQYRFTHPIQQIPFRQDKDLKEKLDNKVCVSLLKYLIL